MEMQLCMLMHLCIIHNLIAFILPCLISYKLLSHSPVILGDGVLALHGFGTLFQVDFCSPT